MAITSATIISHLESLNQYYEVGEKIITFDPDTPSIKIEITIEDNGKTFRMIAKSTIIEKLLEKITDEDFEKIKCELYEELLQYNAITKFGAWEVFIKEPIYAVEVPVEDSTITKNQFERMFNLVDRQSKNFNKIIDKIKSLLK